MTQKKKKKKNKSAAGKKNKKKGNKKSDHWPNRAKLLEAYEIFEEFRGMCQHQMDLGYWATIDFPTKHHLNKLLAIQYMEEELLIKVYGKALVTQVKKLIPYCKGYLNFVREEVEHDINGESSNSSPAKTSTKN
jgi:hypothetical protein